jgi:hypothetical protein
MEGKINNWTFLGMKVVLGKNQAHDPNVHNNLIAHCNLLVMLFSFGFWLVMVLIEASYKVSGPLVLKFGKQ